MNLNKTEHLCLGKNSNGIQIDEGCIGNVKNTNVLEGLLVSIEPVKSPVITDSPRVRQQLFKSKFSNLVEKHKTKS